MKRLIAIFICFLFFITVYPSTIVEAEMKSRAELEADLAALELQIKEQKDKITQTQQEKATLARDISILQSRITASKLQIQAHENSIARLGQSISEKDRNILSLDDKFGREKDSLAQILRKSAYIDTYSLLDFGLQSKSLSDFFIDSDAFLTLQKALDQSFKDIRTTKTDLELAKSDLLDTKKQEEAVKLAKVLESKKITSNQKEKQNILTITKGQEAIYQKLLNDKQAQAATIRSTLFELSGSKAISFGVAYDLALKAQKLTGIRPAFLLGIITEESNLGQNVGKGTWKVDMHPTRDQPIFDDLTRDLGLNPDNMPVSKKVWYGYGGAMGPAQFIPSTWVIFTGYVETPKGSGNWVYNPDKDRLGKLTGHQPPSPWTPEDAFMASAMLLKDNGAIAYNRASEHRAAVCYLAGCGNAKKASYQFYGNDVMGFADKYEEQIKILQAN